MLTLDALYDAAARIAPYAYRTPVLEHHGLNHALGAKVYFKAEHLQRMGAFKFRGACNAVFSLTSAQAAQGVVTHSSGNHGAALALACQLRGIPATIVVPRNAPETKRQAIADHGANIVLCEPTHAERHRITTEILATTGGELIHPFDDERVIAGQGTATLEFLKQVPELDIIIAPVSGGGLLSGTVIAAKAVKPSLQVFGAEPEGAADAYESLQQNRRITDGVPNTICDGLRAQLSERTFGYIRHHCDGILLASDDEVRHAMSLLFEQMKQVVEPSGAIGLAVLQRNAAHFAGKRVGLLISGGNLDLSSFFFNLSNHT